MATARPTMLTYVHETPSVLRSQLERDVAAPLAQAFVAGSHSRVRIIACGSSKNAATIARPYVRSVLGREVDIVEPYTFCAYERDAHAATFTFVVSQSGYSTNALAALAAIRESGGRAIGVTGDPASDFAGASDLLVDYGVGVELVGYVTKGVSALANFLCLFALDVARAEGRIDDAEREREVARLADVAGDLARVAGDAPAALTARYKELSNLERVFMVGAGANYGIACEGALKFGECLQIPAMALELEEYLHGPNLQLSPDYAVFFNLVGSRDHARGRQLVEATRLVTDHVFVLTDDPEAAGADVSLAPQDGSLAAPIALLPYYQTLAYQLTDDRHLWHKHPLVSAFDRAVSGKSENYVDREVL